jgi:fibro-slime domain-containing protein
MTGRSRAWRRWAWVVTTIGAAAFEARCGARTALPIAEMCGDAGSMRRCQDSCGEGEQVCQYGYWQPCVVPSATRSCSNTCGAGEQTCIEDGWLPCSVPVATRPCASLCGPGTETCADDVWGACNAALPVPPTLTATARNSPPGNPDFLQMCCSGGPDPGIVASTLGPDDKPVYAGNPITGTFTTHGLADFNQWYNNGPGVVPTTISLPFMPEAGMPGFNVFDNQAFFPIGDIDFTVEAHARILYVGGESYGFASDDDLWVFINRTLAVDLGGVHPALSAGVDLDQMASQLGIVKGQMYPLDMFYANRQPPGAVLMISIPQSDLWSCP